MDNGMYQSLKSEYSEDIRYPNINAVSDYLLLKKVLRLKKEQIEEECKNNLNKFLAEIKYSAFETKANGFNTRELNKELEALEINKKTLAQSKDKE